MTEDIGYRLWEHFKMPHQTGSAWTKKYLPVSVIHCSEIHGTMEDFKWIERQSTLRLAKLKGFENVRGGGFSLTTSDYPAGWDEHLKNVPAAKLDLMKPLSKSELNELLKGKYDQWRHRPRKRKRESEHDG
ncbi:hypothetical protein [Marispirochaeta aestuarii]|uniref:hypothetical protein n=1 Tax=Marispirochaeta aestuarii TaxID=1963862 RepID=UPI0029C87274|nr:hypothetical protein [Marispirochaeta aestuarii]